MNMDNLIVSSLKRDWNKCVVENKAFLEQIQKDESFQHCQLYSRFRDMISVMELMMFFIENNKQYVTWTPCDKFQPEVCGFYFVTLGSSEVSYCYFSAERNDWNSVITGLPMDVKAWAEKPNPYPFWENEEWWKKKHGGLIE